MGEEYQRMTEGRIAALEADYFLDYFFEQRQDPDEASRILIPLHESVYDAREMLKEIRALHKELAARDAEIERLKAIANATKDEGLEEMRKKFRLRDEIDAALGYAGRLFLHYHPECELQPDLMGVLTQIDNAMTVIPALRTERDDLRRQVREKDQELTALQALFNEFRRGYDENVAALAAERDHTRKLELMNEHLQRVLNEMEAEHSR